MLCAKEWRQHQDLLHSWQLPPEFLREKGATLDNRHTLRETWNDTLQRLYVGWLVGWLAGSLTAGRVAG